MCSLKRAHFEMVINCDGTEGTFKRVRLDDFISLKTLIGLTLTFVERIVNMMLSSDLVSQHASTETTLVSDNKQVRGRSDSMI